jgi:hypothetical protein
LRPTDSVNLAQFGVLAAVRSNEGYVTPAPNLFFWFGDVAITPPSWIILFTGKGQSKPAPLIEHGIPVHVFYWNLENTIFNNTNVAPVVFKINSILVGHNVLPPDKRQIENPAR